ncbi:MAG: nuclease-related domain-containing protein [Rhodocyclaceae bacterium]|nr:nuclease-related domain-containing protein [Rhodocyclaceae bacterium]
MIPMWTVLAVAFSLLPTGIMLLVIYLARWRLDRDSRREPLTTELRRLPSDSLERRREDMLNEVQGNVIEVIAVGPAVCVAILSLHLPKDVQLTGADAFVLFIGLCVSIFVSWRGSRRMGALRQLRQGILAEKAVAQEISDVLAGNNRIIHDVQAGEFNIDHVVITPAGVFAVETKSRLKPAAGQGVEVVKVCYDGYKLEFPGWTDTDSLVQARRQADWLARHLQKATGETFAVQAVLALPGWFVKNTAPISDNMVRVINPKKSDWLFTKPQSRLDPAALQRAVFAVEKLAGVAKD